MFKLTTITGVVVSTCDTLEDAITARDEAYAQQEDVQELIIVDDEGKEC